jgi:hypothetical protein
METLTFAGKLSEGWGESDEALTLTETDDKFYPEFALAERLEEIHKKQVSVRYWITDEKVTRKEAQEAFLKTLLGAADVEWWARYSEITGYLWTDEELKIGGHDLLEELKSHLGKWLILEIDVHDD